MTNGAVLFAQNNTTIDYIKLAVYASNKIKKNLNLPVSLITDNKKWLLDNFPEHNFDKIIEIKAESTPQKKIFP